MAQPWGTPAAKILGRTNKMSNTPAAHPEPSLSPAPSPKDGPGVLALAAGSAAEADARLWAFVDRHCICRNCFWVTERHAGGLVTCRHPEGALIDGIPHVDTTTCECNDLADLVLAAELQALMDDHYAKADAEGLFDPPNV
jgi:hypothetical protein